MPTWAGILYLTVVLHAYSRRVVGWAIANHLRTQLVLDALNMALFRRCPTNVVHHSDQGCQYTSIAFGLRCREAGVLPSMGSVGDCYDNAVCESFNATLECELLAQHHSTHRAASLRTIEAWRDDYNARRPHKSLGHLTPNEFANQQSQVA